MCIRDSSILEGETDVTRGPGLTADAPGRVWLTAIAREIAASRDAWWPALGSAARESDALISGTLTIPLVAAAALGAGIPSIHPAIYPLRRPELGVSDPTERALIEPWRDWLEARMGRLRGAVLDEVVARGARIVSAWSPTLLEAGAPVGAIRASAVESARLAPALDPEIDAWIDGGEPPVVLGFGSMPAPRGAASIGALARSLDARGLRVLVIGDGREAPVGPGVRSIAACDLPALLPRCRAAIHHGGSGTTHTSLAAGVPTLVCAITLDQPTWGRAVEAAGAGAWLAAGSATDAALSDALDRTLSVEARTGAQRISAAMRDEDGAAAVLGMLEARR